MSKIHQCLSFFKKNITDSISDKGDENIKLQAFLIYADLAYLSEYQKPLFDDEIQIFRQGRVIERIRFQSEMDSSDRDCESIHLPADEQEILDMVLAIFGKASAQEIIEILQTFSIWNTGQSTVKLSECTEDIKKMGEIISAYQESARVNTSSRMINGIMFFYNGLELTDHIIEKFEKFSLSAEESAYSIYMDDGNLVIY